ncbi:MAG TPA: ATP-binding protein, partial [Gammaproteobacteria bacterium]|nr:ATP-binding protein [Gammaproteobacteria bacterium]
INLWALVFTGISVVFMGGLMAVAVSYTVNRPIRNFLAAIRQIPDGGATARVQVQTGDEFEILASHFNDMMARINSFNEELDERVRAATRELDERYQELQRLNQLLYATQRKLTQAERLALAGQVVAQVAHEVGTPLHSVAGHLELMRAELPKDTPAGVARRLEIIDSQVARLSSIIRQLLELVRRDRPPFVAVDVSTLVQAAAELVSPGASAAGLELRVKVERDLPTVNGNADQLTQALLNLLANAIDATGGGGVITIEAQRRRREVAIAVRDTGSGISAERQREIFEPFVSSKPYGRGTGLGLYIADQIVRDHRGSIVVESREGQGTTMTVLLPMRGEQS